MKKTMLWLLIVIFMICSQSAFAAGKLVVTQENFWVVDSYSTYAYAYARIENIGDKPIKTQAGVLEVFDENGDTITSSDSLHSYAEYLQPNEYTYAYMYTSIDKKDPPYIVDDYLLTITGKSNSDYISFRLPCEVKYEEDVSSGWSTYDYMYATITNNTDDPIYEIRVVFALLDDDDNILYMTSDTMDSNKALMPGSSVIIREYVNSSNKDAYTSAGLVATHVDAIAYATIAA